MKAVYEEPLSRVPDYFKLSSVQLYEKRKVEK